MDATSEGRRSPSEPTEPAREPQGAAVRIISWSPSGTRETDAVTALSAMVADADTQVWVDLTDPSPDIVRSVASDLGLHPLIAEDVAERNERAKVATYDDMLHVVLFDLEYRGEVVPAEVDFVLGKRFLLSVHGSDCDLRSRIEERNGGGPILAKGADFMLYTIADRIVDGYFPVLDALADEIDDLQDKVVESASEWTLQRLFVLKRELLAIRRATSPAREVLNQLTNRDLTVISPDHVVYYRDVYDHLIRVTDELDNYRELVSGTLDIYLSTVNNNLSRIMKRLTGVTVILAGIGAVAGIFGMSEAALAVSNGEKSGFWLITAIIVVAAVMAAVILRRIDWI
jgi:magnesium transporter